jgi:uncharacterized membrane protein
MRFIPIMLGLIFLWAEPAQAFFGLFGNSMEEVRAKDGLVALDIAKLAPEASRHYRYQDGKNLVRFFIVRDKQNITRVALDACEVCWREGKGYIMKNGAMFCINCGRQFALHRIGIVTGGCNPHPVKFSLEGNTLSITAQELLTGANYFPENRP